MNGHSSIAPSSAHVWAPENGCGGWRTMSARFPETERSQPAEEGTAAHELAARMVYATSRARVGFPVRGTVVGTMSSNGVVFTDEMFDGALAYNEIISPLIKGARTFGGQNLGIEQRVAAPGIHPELYGTPDFFLYCLQTVTLHIYDFKYGKGPVDAFENWQMMVYAASIIETLMLNDPALKISINIVQPRLHTFKGAPSQWNLPVSKLHPFIEQIRIGAARAFEPAAETHSGPHCRYCTARTSCPAAIAAGLQYIEATSENVPVNLSAPEKARLLTMLVRARAHIGSLVLGYETELTALAKTGTPIPGYRLEPTRGHTTWDKPVEEIFRLGDLYGTELRKAEPITPNQAKAAGMEPTIVDHYSSRTVHGNKLVYDDGSHARKVFGS